MISPSPTVSKEQTHHGHPTSSQTTRLRIAAPPPSQSLIRGRFYKVSEGDSPPWQMQPQDLITVDAASKSGETACHQCIREAEEKAWRQADDRARCEIEDKATREAEEKALREVEEKAWREASTDTLHVYHMNGNKVLRLMRGEVSNSFEAVELKRMLSATLETVWPCVHLLQGDKELRDQDKLDELWPLGSSLELQVMKSERKGEWHSSHGSCGPYSSFIESCSVKIGPDNGDFNVQAARANKQDAEMSKDSRQLSQKLSRVYVNAFEKDKGSFETMMNMIQSARDVKFFEVYNSGFRCHDEHIHAQVDGHFIKMDYDEDHE